MNVWENQNACWRFYMLSTDWKSCRTTNQRSISQKKKKTLKLKSLQWFKQIICSRQRFSKGFFFIKRHWFDMKLKAWPLISFRPSEFSFLHQTNLLIHKSHSILFKNAQSTCPCKKCNNRSNGTVTQQALFYAVTCLSGHVSTSVLLQPDQVYFVNFGQKSSTIFLGGPNIL